MAKTNHAAVDGMIRANGKWGRQMREMGNGVGSSFHPFAKVKEANS